jgi:hypothetical protein
MFHALKETAHCRTLLLKIEEDSPLGATSFQLLEFYCLNRKV